MGAVTKLPCGGGEGAVHSSVVASHGLSFTFSPCLMLQKKLIINGIWASPMTHAAQEIGAFHWKPVNPQIVWSFDTFHPCPPSYQRLCIPAIPCKNIGRNAVAKSIGTVKRIEPPQSEMKNALKMITDGIEISSVVVWKNALTALPMPVIHM